MVDATKKTDVIGNKKNVTVNKGNGNNVTKPLPLVKNMKTDATTDSFELQRQALKNFTNDFEKEIEIPVIGKVKKLSHKKPLLGESYFQYYPDKDETFGDLKTKYNLPDDIFSKMLASQGVSGDRDQCKIIPPLEIPEETLINLYAQYIINKKLK